MNQVVMKVLVVGAALVMCVNVGFAQNGKFGKSPGDSIECVKNLSVYKSPYFDGGDYIHALVYWQRAMSYCPKSRESLYINGVKMYKKFIKDAKDGPTTEMLMDSMFMIYDWRIEHFGKEGYVLGRKGCDMLKYRKQKVENIKAARDVLKKSFDLQGNKAEAGAIACYYQSLYMLIRKKEAECSEMIELYPKLTEVISYNIANQQNDKIKAIYQKTQENVDKMFSPCASCDDLERIFTPKFKEAPDDIDQMKLIIKLLKYGDCADRQLFKDVAVALYDKEPSAEAASALGDMFIKEGNCSKAIQYYKQVAEQAEETQMKIEAYMKIAKCNFNIKQFASVRTYCKKALGLNPNLGEAYVLIGDAYSASAKACGDGACHAKAAYWAAVDKYERAKAVDPTVAGKANKRIAAAKAQFPTKEDCFFHTLNNGDAYKVECWINEDTKVRVR